MEEVMVFDHVHMDLSDLTKRGLCIDLNLSEDKETYDYMVQINGQPIGGGVISNEGLPPEMTAAKIAKLCKADRLVRMFA